MKPAVIISIAVVLLGGHLVDEGDLRLLGMLLMPRDEPRILSPGHYLDVSIAEAMQCTDLDTETEP